MVTCYGHRLAETINAHDMATIPPGDRLATVMGSCASTVPSTQGRISSHLMAVVMFVAQGFEVDCINIQDVG